MVYRPGDFNRICDRTGYKVKASETRKEWNGLIVDKRVWEARHPQDLLRSFADNQAVPDARTEAADKFLGDNEVTVESL